MNDWPDHFPPSCPPPDAVEASGEMYRLVNSDPLTSVDFMSHMERLAAGMLKKRYWNDDCVASGLSVFVERDEADYVRRSVGPLRGAQLARGSIDNAGFMKHT